MIRDVNTRRVLTLLCSLLWFVGGVAAQESEPVTPKTLVGVWDGTAQTPNGEVTIKVTFTLTDDKLAATVESSMGPMPVTAITLVEDKLTMELVIMETQASLAAKVQGKRMEGTWALGAESGPFTLVKAGGAPQTGLRSSAA